MAPSIQPKERRAAKVLYPTVGFALLTAFMVATASAVPNENSIAEITVVFTADDMGFNVTSDKDLSNIIVLLCDETDHKHDGLTGYYFNHTESQQILGIWVKSGSYQDPNGPPGAGEWFENVGVECGRIPYFPTPLALGVAAVGAVTAAAFILRRRN